MTGDFAVRHALKIGEFEDGALFFRKRIERGLHAAEQFALGDNGIESDRKHDSVFGEFVAFAGIALAEARDGAVARDYHQPARERPARGIELRSVEPELIENVLQDFFRSLRIAKNAIEDRREHARVAVVEGREGGLVALDDSLDERRV